MSAQLVETLHLRAIEQRNQLHQSAAELKSRINTTHEQFDVSRNLRKHFSGLAIATAAIALLAGYRSGAAFIRR